MAAMPWFLWADELVYRWLQFHRTCATPMQADALQLVVVGLLVVLVAVAVLTRGWRHPAELAAAIATVATGVAIGELLKTILERLRPRALPITSGANSFPSGHIMNTALIALAAYVLVRRSTASRWLRALACAVAVASICGQATARVVRGSHWMSDVPGSVLVALAWTLGAGAFVRRSHWGSLAVGLSAAAAFAVAYYVPAVRLSLPSALDDALLRAATPAGEGDSAFRVDVDAPSEQRLTVPGAVGGRVLKIALQARCAEHPRDCCASIIATVNDWEAPALTISSAWHEIHLVPPPGVLRVGPNTVTLKVPEEHCGGGRECVGIGVAFARVSEVHAASDEVAPFGSSARDGRDATVDHGHEPALDSGRPDERDRIGRGRDPQPMSPCR